MRFVLAIVALIGLVASADACGRRCRPSGTIFRPAPVQLFNAVPACSGGRCNLK